MKRVAGFFIGMFIIGITAVNAQQSKDSTSTQKRTSTRTESNQFNQKDYTLVQPSEIPSSLRETLKDNRYTGWENGKVYKDKNNNGYWVRIASGSDVQNFVFDKNGKAADKGPGVGKSPQ